MLLMQINDKFLRAPHGQGARLVTRAARHELTTDLALDVFHWINSSKWYVGRRAEECHGSALAPEPKHGVGPLIKEIDANSRRK